ncbi:MAG: class I SAM-dependent methyltransferase [Bacteroidetes bacterium]|nr:class I SAM-dependent methyltransferase [Bacteroidota bacterium]
MKNLIRSFLYEINKYIYSGNQFYCNICNKYYRKFFTAGENRRPNARCPGCGAFERHRLMMYFLKDKTDFFSDNLSVLDIAPLQTFHKLFSKMENINYISIDMKLPYVTKRADLTNLPFKDESFDCIICYHVLEHIIDDNNAIREMYRVLKKGGWAIIQSPFDNSLEYSFERQDIITKAERKKFYGQDDHVRIYGRDLIKRIEFSGFVVKEDDFIKKFSDKEIIKFALDKEEIINYCIKP